RAGSSPPYWHEFSVADTIPGPKQRARCFRRAQKFCLFPLVFRDQRYQWVALPDVATTLQHVPEPAYTEYVRILAARVVQFPAEVRDVPLHQVLCIALAVILLVHGGEKRSGVDAPSRLLSQHRQ